MMKKNMKLNKLIALAVLMGGVTCCSSVLAAGTVIKIGTTGTNPNDYSATTGVGVDASSTSRTLGSDVDKIVTWDGSTEGGAIDVFAGVYGIKTVLSSSVTADSITNGINVNCSDHNVWGIYLASSGTNNVNDIGSISVKEGGNGIAKGIEATSGTNTFTFTGDTRFINVESASSSSKKYGIYLANGTNYIGTDAISTTGHELGSITVGGTGSTSAYGIVAGGGENTVAFIDSGSLVTATSSSSAYGIGFCNVGSMSTGPATGTTTIEGLGSVTATSTGSGSAYGIYVKNGNVDDKKFTVEFVKNTVATDGVIEAYSATGENCGIMFDKNTSGDTGKSEVLNVKTIVAGVDSTDNTKITSGKAYGICADAGVNNVAFTGKDSSITAMSSGEAYGVYAEGGTNSITGLGKIDVTFASDKTSLIYLTGGSLTLEFAADGPGLINVVNNGTHGKDEVQVVAVDGSSSMTIKNLKDIKMTGIVTTKLEITSGGTIILDNSTIEATEGIDTIGAYDGDSDTLNLQNNSKVSGDIDIQGATLTVDIDSTSELHIGDIKGGSTLNITNGGKVCFNKATTMNGILTNNASAVEVAAKGVSVETITGSAGADKYTFTIPTGIAKDGTEAMLNITGTTALAFDANDVLTVNVGNVVSDLKIADKITLINATTAMTGYSEITAANKVVKNGGDNWTEGKIGISTDNKQLTFTVIGIKYVDVVPDAVTGNTVTVASAKEATITNGSSTSTVKFNDGEGTATSQDGPWHNIYGGWSETENEAVSGNTVNITGGSISESVYGGYSASGAAGSEEGKGNTVTVSGADTGSIKSVYGGFGATGASYNKVIVESTYTGTVIGDDGVSVAGGFTGGDANDNIVNISSGTYSAAVVGGYTYGDGETNGNEVTISGSTGSIQAIYGGMGTNDASSNKVTVESTYTGTVKGDSADRSVTGGFSGVNVDGNDVIIKGGTYSATIVGGWTEGGTAGTAEGKGNTVTVSGVSTGDIKGICGGCGASGASYNKVTVESSYTGTVSKSGAGTEASVAGGFVGGNGNADNNEVSISGGIYNAPIYGGYSASGAADSNKVMIAGGIYSGPVFGGYAETGDAKDNTVILNGGDLSAADIYGGFGATGTSSGNTLVVGMKNLTVAKVADFQKYTFTLLVGSKNGDTMLNITGTTALTIADGDVLSVNNVVNLADGDTITLITEATGTFNLKGLTFYLDGVELTDEVGEYFKLANNDKSITFTKAVLDVDIKPINKTSGNIVTVTGDRTATVEGETIKTPKEGRNWRNVYGGYSKDGDSINNKVIWEDGVIVGELFGGYSETTGKDVTTGNTLTVVCKDATKTIKAVNNFSKYVFDINVAKNNDTVLTITDKALSIPSGENVITIKDDQNIALRYKGSVYLINDEKGIDVAELENNNTRYDDHIVITYGKYSVEDGKKLIYTKTSEVNKDGSKAPVEGMAAAASTINTSSDLVLGAGISNLITSTAEVDNTETFAASSYNKSKLKTGSHADVSGYGVVVGVGRKVISKNGNKTTGGLFFEYGNNNYDTFNNGYNGDGKSIHKGAGYLMRWDNKSGNYYEGMVHVGKVTNNWNNGAGYNYDMSPTYFGGAATYGHKFMLGDNKQLSVYGSYIYSRTGGGDAVIGNYKYNFEAIKSHRTKVGVRYALSDLMDTKKFRPYVGLAWEHEFNGESNASFSAIKGSFNGRPESPSMKGDTGILEIGCKQEVGKWTLGIGAELFAGKRRGWNGTLQAVYNF